ncbi:YqjF family protein [Psychrobacillus antarcticus]|uniref:YqjF family protein n=1 Tax=Psychrobacillus antarcticus TaxID=2879115 RepID=UPI0024078292|nr:DUF2071 domain-containing protein [Psychrobacillus antarcticus]
MTHYQKFTKAKWDDGHRLWPLPKSPWVMKQTWNDLLFAHFPVKFDLLRKLVPDVFPLDTFDGMCWVGVVPFHMTNIRLRGLPPVPGTDKFPELNVRTYVMIDGKPGVYFFSLDATNLLAIKVARTFFHLPYVHAHMKVEKHGDLIGYVSRRKEGDARFVANYRPVSKAYFAEKGSFEEWLVERYCLYTVNSKGVPLRCDILHHPWLLQRAESEIKVNTMLSSQGIVVENETPVLHYSRNIEVRMWPLVKAF